MVMVEGMISAIVVIVVIVMVEGMGVGHIFKIVLKESMMWISLVWKWSMMRGWVNVISILLRISFRERVYGIAITTDVTVLKGSLFSFPFPLSFLFFSLPCHLFFSLLLLHLPLFLLSLLLCSILIVSWLIVDGIILMYGMCAKMLCFGRSVVDCSVLSDWSCIMMVSWVRMVPWGSVVAGVRVIFRFVRDLTHAVIREWVGYWSICVDILTQRSNETVLLLSISIPVLFLLELLH